MSVKTKKIVYRVGDWVKMGAKSKKSMEYRGEIGGGWYPNKVFQIVRIVKNTSEWGDNKVYFPLIGWGVWNENFTKYSPKNTPKSLSIGGYRSVMKKGQVTFGCQSFTKLELRTILRLLDSPINADIKIKNTNITKELVLSLL